MATEYTRGHLSAKLVIKDTVKKTEQWMDYDTREEIADPVEGTIMVFNSATGVYEKCDCLQHAVDKFDEHNVRLTPTFPAEHEILKEKRELLKAEGKHLRNLGPFSISVRTPT